MQKVVRARADGATFLLPGDPLLGARPDLDGRALPVLLEEGWSVVAVHMTASAGASAEQHAAFFVIERAGA